MSWTHQGQQPQQAGWQQPPPPQQGGWQQPPPQQQGGWQAPGQPQATSQQGWAAPAQQQPPTGFQPPPPIAPATDRLMAIFQQVDRDRSGKVSALELKQCMESSGYRFSAETCKMMVNMFDRDGNGQISFDEFVALNGYIVQMQDAFRRVDADGSNRLEAHEVQNALVTSGYTLSPQTFQALMRKFDRHRSGGLGFDGYIELCVFIGTARNTYADFDVQRRGTVTFNFDQFVYAANRTNFL